MPRFFESELDENNITLTGSDAHHIGRSLRICPGEALTVCHCGIDYNFEIASITEDSVYLELKAKCPQSPFNISFIN